MTGSDKQPPTQFESWLADVTNLHMQLTTWSLHIDAAPEVRLAAEALERARSDLKALVDQEKSYREIDQ